MRHVQPALVSRPKSFLVLVRRAGRQLTTDEESATSG